LRIAYIYDAVYPWVKGGAEKRVYEIARRLADRGHEVYCFGLKWWDGENDIVREGINISGIGKWDNLYVDGRRSIKEGLYFGIKVLWGLKGEFDVIDCQQFPYFSCFSTKIYSLLKKQALAITWYELWNDYWYEYLGRKGFFGWAVERLALKVPKLLIPISEKIKQDLISLNVPERIIRMIPNGVDFHRLQGIKEWDKEFDVIYVGRLISHKNVDVLIRAISILKDNIPDVRCGIIGDGPKMDELKALTRKLALNENIKFFGFIESDEEVYILMKSSKVFVLPSIREGFPNTIIEANACGLPVIIMDHKNNASTGVVEDGYNGFIVNLSPEEIAGKVIYLLQNQKESNQLSKNAVDFARNYDWSIIVNKLEGVYKEASA
jgi:glycosyltransferase involved in cell wall biosynthesis